MFSKDTFDKELLFKTHKEFLKLKTKKINKRLEQTPYHCR